MMSFTRKSRVLAVAAAIATAMLAAPAVHAMDVWVPGPYGGGWHNDGYNDWHRDWHGAHSWGARGGHWQSWHHRVVVAGNAWPYAGYYGYTGSYPASPSYSVDDYWSGDYSAGNDYASTGDSVASSAGGGYSDDNYLDGILDGYGDGGPPIADGPASGPYDGPAHPDGN